MRSVPGVFDLYIQFQFNVSILIIGFHFISYFRIWKVFGPIFYSILTLKTRYIFFKMLIMSNIRNFFLWKTFLVLGNLLVYFYLTSFFGRKSMKETKYNNRGYFINSLIQERFLFTLSLNCDL